MEKKTNLIKFISCAVLLLIAYLPTINWMVGRWNAEDSYYSHGFLIPLISIFLAWQRKDKIKDVLIKSDARGLWLIIAGLLVHIACAALRVGFLSGFSLIFVIYGLVLFFFGVEMARLMRFPIFFLLTMVPLPLVLVSNLTVKIKLFAAQCATFILNHIGFPSVRDGSMIRMPNSVILVEAPCSGLRSLISLLTLGLLFAYMLKASFIKKGILLLSAIPLAVATNMLRIIMLGTVNDLYGEKAAFGFFHDFSGFLVFALAFAGMLWMYKILENR
ncbi:MAG: exosortase/archaeosortase family protein [Candidatus Omnitrophica bacterium]|nr:exosortase/archaeosortase family protein [Candidatus Omnitrophota bacterium]